jgi:hypothetical protein
VSGTAATTFLEGKSPLISLEMNPDAEDSEARSKTAMDQTLMIRGQQRERAKRETTTTTTTTALYLQQSTLPLYLYTI